MRMLRKAFKYKSQSLRMDKQWDLTPFHLIRLQHFINIARAVMHFSFLLSYHFFQRDIWNVMLGWKWKICLCEFVFVRASKFQTFIEVAKWLQKIKEKCYGFHRAYSYVKQQSARKTGEKWKVSGNKYEQWIEIKHQFFVSRLQLYVVCKHGIGSNVWYGKKTLRGNEDSERKRRL